jgi:hypothetical protein
MDALHLLDPPSEDVAPDRRAASSGKLAVEHLPGRRRQIERVEALHQLVDVGRDLRMGEQPKESRARQIFRDLIDMPADVAITENEIAVRFYRRAHLPIVLASGLFDKPVKVPWWDGRSLRFIQ